MTKTLSPCQDKVTPDQDLTLEWPENNTPTLHCKCHKARTIPNQSLSDFSTPVMATTKPRLPLHPKISKDTIVFPKLKSNFLTINETQTISLKTRHRTPNPRPVSWLANAVQPKSPINETCSLVLEE